MENVCQFLVEHSFEVDVVCDTSFYKHNIWQVWNIPFLRSWQIIQNNNFCSTCSCQGLRQVASNGSSSTRK